MKLYGTGITVTRAAIHMTAVGNGVMGTMIVYSEGEDDQEDVLTAFSTQAEGEVTEELLDHLTRKLTGDYADWMKYMEDSENA